LKRVKGMNTRVARELRLWWKDMSYEGGYENAYKAVLVSDATRHDFCIGHAYTNRSFSSNISQLV
jgi:hypothetical protein